MSKKNQGLVGIIMVAVILCLTCLSGCGLFDNNKTPTEYTIQYTDDTGTHKLTVADGAPYSLEVLPVRLGYDFIGLFDAKVGGTQYVDETGQSLTPFTDKKNIVLFPRFTAKEYTIVLDYQGATITGERSITVKYDEKLPELPKNLSKEHSEFTGWYTEENCGGIQVADSDGLIPDKSTLNDTLFDIEDASEYLYLYAGFDIETFTVTFNYDNGIPQEEMKVEYNTPISEIIPETRNNEGKAVLNWSKMSNGEPIFTGNITYDMVLYAVEWAPVIELDLNGGKGKNAVVAREGATVALPTPVRENYKFLYWETMRGEEANITQMPADGTQLKAVWQAMLVFDENGGTAVQNISQAAGTAVTLPIPEKEGFIFAGWYTADEEKYTASSMPATSVELQAGWYKPKEITLHDPEEDTKYIDEEGLFFRFDLTEFDDKVDLSGSNTVTVSGQFMADQCSTEDLFVGLFKTAVFEPIDEHAIWYFPHDNISGYQKRTFNATIQIENGEFYIGMIAPNDIYYVMVQKLFVTIKYPDTTKLYL